MTLELPLPPPPRLPADPAAVQALASDPAASVWVNASAGTGKTKVLTDRVLRLLLAETRPERLLCLTFTKAAAAEMANRVQERLAQWVTMPAPQLEAVLAALTGGPVSDALLARARRLFARVVDCPGGLKIQTIHAFGQSLLRRFPVEAGVPPQFEVMEEATAAGLLQRAMEAVVAGEGRSSALQDAVDVLARLLPVDDFSRLLQTLVMERSRLRRLFDAYDGLPGVLAKLDADLGIAPGETRTARLARLCRDGGMGGLNRAQLDEAVEALERGSETDKTRAACIRAFLALAEDARGEGWPAYCGAFLTATGDNRKTLITKGALKANPQVERILQIEQERVADGAKALCAFITRECSAAALTVADAVLAAYARHKAATAQLDFDDIVLKVRDLLGEDGGPSWVMFKLDGGLDHILVDEAQDTNPDQWEIVAALTGEFFSQVDGRQDGRTLFVVGDEKQSIYSFQRADPEKFKAMRGHFRTVIGQREDAWREVPLQTSFRSTAPVLALVDAVYSVDDYRAGVSELDIAHLSFRAAEAGRVELWPLVTAPAADAEGEAPQGSAKDLAQRRLAELLAAEIAGWLARGELLPAKGRPIRPGDIMILMRSRSGLVAELQRALAVAGVPVAGRDRMVLTDELAVQDLIAFARFLLLPEDDLTLACLLKTPLIGLDEDALFQLAWRREGSLWQALQRAARRDGAPGSRIAAAAEWLGTWLARTDYLRPFELLAAVLSQPCPGDAVSGRRALVGRLGYAALDPLAELLSAALGFQSQAVPTLEAFLHWLTRLQADVKREQEQAADGPGFVRIMTVHGSKGLQAPIVILPDTMSDAARAAERLFFPQDPGQPPRLVASAKEIDRDSDRVKSDWAMRQAQEHRRLLYVALTRAEDRLIVCGAQGARTPKDAEDSDKTPWHGIVARGFAALDAADPSRVERQDAQALLGVEGEVLLLRSGQAKAVPLALPDAPPPVLPALPVWAIAAAPMEPEPHRPLAPSRPDAPEPAVASPRQRDSQALFRRGRLVHTLLQVLPGLSPADRPAAAAAYLAQPGHGLKPEEPAELAAEVLAVLDHPGLAGVFDAGALAEVPVGGVVMLGGRVRTISGQIDRLLLAPDRTVLVDFKTVRPPPRRVEAVARATLQQLAAYRALLAEMRPGVPVDTVLVWTFTAQVMPVPAALLDEAFSG